MVKSRKQKQRSRKRTQRKQRGGGDGAYGFHGPAFMAGAVPYATRDANYTQCGWDSYRTPPQVGGGCGGCAGGAAGARLQTLTPEAQRGGGSGNGGHAIDIAHNTLGKTYAGYIVPPCPPAPHANSLRGGAASASPPTPHSVVAHNVEHSYKTGFTHTPADVYSTPSAHFLGHQGYIRTMSGGRRKSHRKSHRKSRR
uniref:Uncharacterized protein n=1 Tax=viral metagenome TaxID=1070528 RepID=A0A6C0DB26_9ZZZZ